MYYGSEGLADCMMAYAGRAAACTTMNELAALATDSMALAGVTAIASGMITGPRVARGQVFHFNTWSQAWLDHYTARGFVDIDPLPRWAVVSGAPARWSDVLRGLPPNDPGRDVAAQAQAFGYLEGVITPVRSYAGHLGLVSVGGPRPTLTPEEFHFLHTLSVATLLRAEALSDEPPPPAAPRLSRREQECVVLLTQGLTEREMAARLGISEVTARFHLDNARTKTGARSRTHLAAIAAQWLGRPRP